MGSIRRPIITKRACILLTLLLLTGTIVNVAVACGSLWLPHAKAGTPFGSYVSPTGQSWGVGYNYWKLLGRGMAMPWNAAGGFPAPPCETWMSWTNWPEALDAIQSPDGAMMIEIRGWPMYSMRARWASHKWVSGITLTQPTQNASGAINLGEQRALPVEIIWPAFAINTLFYASIVWLLFVAPFELRRRRRIKRGQCVKCGYPLGASDVCTECGETVKRAAAPRPPLHL